MQVSCPFLSPNSCRPKDKNCNTKHKEIESQSLQIPQFYSMDVHSKMTNSMNFTHLVLESLYLIISSDICEYLRHMSYLEVFYRQNAF